ncbi:short-chain dehydrogenase [Pedobacter psychrophilus]|uniref:Short-chain dehydrogenase n=1 Tax=Pedobacter psychrophilus TaxID=1826909 RepID=A0A179DM79_9SPHI|nr:oxidoreductase [Pedobacter psychrophilus]OAQ41830.1 short-chain dehydrogenase [Pedobacter psychrophilus]
MNSLDIEHQLNQEEKIAIVTGANSGLGFETTKGLAKNGFTVIMACRDLDKAHKAYTEIKKEVSDADLKIIQIDTSSLKSVKAFADEFLKHYQKLDLLINNAGIMVPPYSLTEDGFESQFGTNYLGHFLLTGLLMPALENSEKARVVTLSSIAHKRGKIDFEDLQFKKRNYKKWEAYGQSKLACLMFAYELDRRLKAKGSKIISVASHPGVSLTNLWNHMPWGFSLLSPIFDLFISQSAENGAKPTLMASLDKSVSGGEYFGPTGFNEMKGDPGKVDSTPLSKNKEIAKKLWSVSEELTGINYLD